MHRGRTERGAVRWTVAIGAVLGIAVVGALAWFLFFRGDGLLGPDVPDFSFELDRVKGKGIQGPAAADRLQGSAEDLRSTLDSFYIAGFIDPGKWEEGTFPEALEAFSGPAAQQARRDLENLTLGDTSGRVESVQPKPGRLDVQFLLDGQRAFAAVASTSFRATGRLQDGGRLSIQHQGEYVMRIVDGVWRIVGYRVEGNLEPAGGRGEET